MSDLETQALIMHRSNQMREELKSLIEWEKDMKQMDAKRAAVPDEEAFDPSYPVRNQVQTQSPSSAPSIVQVNKTDDKPKKSAASIPNAIEKANEFKTRGNDCVKNGQYQKAVHYYTEAIRLNKTEPVYYTNRALCYLKQSKFTECIDDCTTAVGLDAKMVKAYYRRMQALEQMNGDLEAALNDCKTVLRIEPKNLDAQKSLSRLEGLLNASRKTVNVKREVDVKIPPAKEILWSQYDGFKQIDFVTKAPHLRSKQPLKRIAIGGSASTITAAPVQIDSNRTTDDEYASKFHIDQTTTTLKTEPIKKTPNKIAITENTENTLKTIPVQLVIPKTSAQFYKTWTSLKENDQKFTILKSIYNADITKILGAQFSLELLRDIFTILKAYFVNENLPIANIMSGIIKNAQMPVISVMMNEEDKLAFTKLVEYMRIRGEDGNKIDKIQKIFDELISM